MSNSRLAKDVGQRILEVADGMGFSQAALARELGLSVGQMNRWVRGEVTPSLKSLRAIADFAGLRMASFEESGTRPREILRKRAAAEEVEGSAQLAAQLVSGGATRLREKMLMSSPTPMARRSSGSAQVVFLTLYKSSKKYESKNIEIPAVVVTGWLIELHKAHGGAVPSDESD